MLIDRICTPAESSTQDRVNRGLTDYNDHLAETLPREYARVLSPLHELIKDIINRGIAEGSSAAGLDVDATAALIMQSALGAMRLQRSRRRTERRADRRRPHLRLLCQRARSAPATLSDLRGNFPANASPRGGVFAGPDVVMSLPVGYSSTKSDFQEADMPARVLPYPVFDADNHFYEPKEALTKFLPDHRKNVIDYIEVRGRTKIMVRNQVSDYIPNPTFEVVARPGAQEEYFRHGSGGKSFREVMGKPMKAIPAFREPAARLEVMDSTRARLLADVPDAGEPGRGAMKDDPVLIHDVIHALNEWMYETWQFNYEGRIFSTPVITLPMCGPRTRGTRVVSGARRKDRPGPPGSGAGNAWHPLVRHRGVRSLLGRLREGRHPRFDARLRLAATPSTSTIGSPPTSSCRSSRPRSGWSRWASGPSRTRWRRWSATAR